MASDSCAQVGLVPEADVACDDAVLASDDATVGSDDATRRYMDAAFAWARDALRHGEVPVGCVMVYSGRVIAGGRNTVNQTRLATRHAEVNCVDAIYRWCEEAGVCPVAVWRATDVYVTVEPCVMCAAALSHLGVGSVRYGCANPRFGGCGSVLPAPEGETVFEQETSRAAEAVGLLKLFYQGSNPNTAALQ